MGTVVLDASVVIGALDTRDAHHDASSHALRRHHAPGSRLLLPTSALSEVLVRPSRHGRAGEAETQIRGLVAGYRDVDGAVAVAAAGLRARHAALRLPDALVPAAAEVEDADVVTADGAWTRYSHRVEVVS